LLGFEDNISRLKDLSELMLELAYSAVFLHEKEFSKQVRSLNEEFKKVYQKTQKDISKVHKQDFAFVSRILVYVKEIAINSVFLSDLSDFERLPKEIKNVLKNTDKRIIEERVGFSSFFAGRTVGELEIKTHTNSKILAVQRNNKWVFGIGKNFSFKPKDLVIAVGDKHSEKVLHHAIAISRIEL